MVSCKPKAAPLWGCFFVSQAGKERQKFSARLEEDGILINRKLVEKVFIILFETDGRTEWARTLSILPCHDHSHLLK